MQDIIKVQPVTARGLAIVAHTSPKLMKAFKSVAQAAGFEGRGGGWIYIVNQPGMTPVAQGWQALAFLVAQGRVDIGLILDPEHAHLLADIEQVERNEAAREAADAAEQDEEYVYDHARFLQDNAWMTRLAGAMSRRGCTYEQAIRYAVENDHERAVIEQGNLWRTPMPTVKLPAHPDHAQFRDLGRQIGESARRAFADVEATFGIKSQPGLSIGKAVYGVHESAADAAVTYRRDKPQTGDRVIGSDIVRFALLTLRDNVLPGWIDGGRDNHEALQRRDAYEATFTPEDIRRMIADAATECGVTL